MGAYVNPLMSYCNIIRGPPYPFLGHPYPCRGPSGASTLNADLAQSHSRHGSTPVPVPEANVPLPTCNLEPASISENQPSRPLLAHRDPPYPCRTRATNRQTRANRLQMD